MDGRTKTVVGALGIVAFALGLVAISVPLYRLVCRETGYLGTPRIATSGPTADMASNKTMVIRWNADVMPGMPWRFYPERPSMTIKLGETNLAVFKAVNTSDQTITGTATFNVTPDKGATYVNKIQCFCFTQQTLGPHETAELPVSFFIDPKIATDPDTNDIGTLTLSYSFFKSKTQEAPAAQAAAPVTRGDKGS